MPWAVLDRHVAGMGGRSGIQRRVQFDIRVACRLPKAIDGIKHPKLNLCRFSRADFVYLWKRSSVGTKLWFAWRRRTCGQKQKCRQNQTEDTRHGETHPEFVYFNSSSAAGRVFQTHLRMTLPKFGGFELRLRHSRHIFTS